MTKRTRHTEYFWWGILLWVIVPCAFWVCIICLLASCRSAKEVSTERSETRTEVRHDTIRIVTERLVADTIRQRDTITLREVVVITADTLGNVIRKETTREIRRTTDRDATHATTNANAVSERATATTLHTDTTNATTIVEKRTSWIQKIKDNVFVLTIIIFLLALAWYIYKRKRRK